MKMEANLKRTDGKGKKIYFFGHFGASNFGNESTLQAILYHLHRLLPEAEAACICTGPHVVAATYNIEAVPISSPVVRLWNPRTRLAKLLRRVFIGLPSELWRYLRAFRTLKGTGMLIIAGTGLVTDVAGLQNWGPHSVFKWSLMARLRRCKLLFVSVGVGPVYSTLGKYFVKSALSLADFRSYRDNASLEYLKRIGFETNRDPIYPDLAFSLPE